MDTKKAHKYPFNLEQALRGEPLITRAGNIVFGFRPITITPTKPCYEYMSDNIRLDDGGQITVPTFTKEGKYSDVWHDDYSQNDLFMLNHPCDETQMQYPR